MINYEVSVCFVIDHNLTLVSLRLVPCFCSIGANSDAGLIYGL